MSRTRVILLTGATSGIGREAALRLARADTTLILPVRNARKGRALASALTQLAPGVHIEVPACDMASLDDVRALALWTLGRFPQLHVLALNAAVVPRVRCETANGVEMQFGVNHLAPFLLTEMLHDRLVASAPARVVVTASKVHYDGRIDFNDLQSLRAYDHATAYAQSKLANVCFALALARRLRGTGVTANSFHPGVYATSLLGDLFAVPRFLRFWMGRRFPPPAAGGGALAKLIEDPALASVTGAYFDVEQVQHAAAAARDEAVQERLWEASAALVTSRGLPLRLGDAEGPVTREVRAETP